MCGICGYFGEAAWTSEDVLFRMNDSLARRGPDDQGSFRRPGVGLAMRRLSIIDVHGGHQPICNEDRTVWVVFNGEIYNYRELRAELLKQGHRFYTNADTEVIVHLYEQYGDAFVHHLRGMFAIAIWDDRRQRGLLVRDRVGIKPLYYAEAGSALLFGSEIKAVQASGAVSRDLDYQALDAFFAFTYIPAPLTIYRGVRKLEPGHLLAYEHGRVEKRRYWDVDLSDPDTRTTEVEWRARFDAAIADAVASHLVSDVPVGAFLSGGVDSSLVVALMCRQSADPVSTFTIGFDAARNALIDERPLASQVAARYKCDAHSESVRPDFREIVGEVVTAFDEPFADDSVIPSYYVSRMARRSVKVALTGLGGDELFAGYERYTGMLLSRHYQRLVPGVLHRHVVQPLIGGLPEPGQGGDRVDHAKRFVDSVAKSPARRYLGFLSTLDSLQRPLLYSASTASKIDVGATDEIVTRPFEACAAPDDLTRALYVDMKTYLPEDILALSDRLSMWHSLELRVPLVDHRLVELSARLPVRFKIGLRRKKAMLKDVAAPYLPSQIMQHRKQGFESPMAVWLRTELSGYARDILGKERLGRSGLFNPEFVSTKLEEHLAGRRKNNKLLFSLIMFQEWYERQGF